MVDLSGFVCGASLWAAWQWELSLAFAFSAINAMLGKDLGYEDTVADVLCEVLTPFLVYLLAETFHVSGITCYWRLA